MSQELVVDASVAVKWVLADEEWSPQAQSLLEQALVARRPIVAPPHLFSEVTNALHQRVHARTVQYRITPDEADEALRQFLAFPIQATAPRDLYRDSLRFAETHGLRSIYDTIYVVLAQMLEAELWTADQRLAALVRTVSPWVRFIGEHPES